MEVVMDIYQVDTDLVTDIRDVRDFLHGLMTQDQGQEYSALDVAAKLLHLALQESDADTVEHRVATSVDVLALLTTDDLALERVVSLARWFDGQEHEVYP
jgi:hypothetical protein